MADYQKMYHTMFNAATDALDQLHLGNTIDAEYLLKKAQLRCEEIFDETEPDISVSNIIHIITDKSKDQYTRYNSLLKSDGMPAVALFMLGGA